MTPATFIGLINNTALLMALVLIYDVVFLRVLGQKTAINHIFTGMVLGLIGIGIMMTPWEFLPGVIFDTRSILLSITGFFFGPVPTLAAVVITGGYRFYIGGTGMWTGIGVIITSGVAGLAWRQLRNKNLEDVTSGELLLLGFATHILMLIWMLTLPQTIAFKVLYSISLPVILIFPLGTLLLGRLMLNRHDRIHTLNKIQESEEKFRSYILSAPSGIFVADGNGFYLEVNKAAEEITGYSRSELLKMNLMDLIVHQDHQKAEAHFKTVVQAGASEGELSYIKKDGSLCWLSVKAVKLGQDRFLAFANDITKRKQAEKALKKSERELSIHHQIAKTFLTVSDEELYGEVLNIVLEVMESPYGTFAYINEDGDRIVPSMTRDIWDECKMPDKVQIFPRKTWGGTLWGRCLVKNKTFISNGPFKFPNGHMQIKRAMATPIIHQGKAVGNFMVGDKATDYTEQDVILLETIADQVAPILASRLMNELYEKERKDTEAKMLKNHYYLTKAQEIGKIGTWELDIRKNILIWTDENYRIFGVPPGTELTYEIFLNCVHPDDRDYVNRK